MVETKCVYCDIESGECCIFIDPLDNSWYMDVRTFEWDNTDGDFIHKREYGINFCPYCGKKLNKDAKGETNEQYL